MPFEERFHTADWALHIWATELSALFSDAANGMRVLSGIVLEKKPRRRRALSLKAPDSESLLVAFLTEILFLGETEHLAFNKFSLHLESGEDGGMILKGTISGAPIHSMEKAIKAVTYHNLSICITERGFETDLVFDV
jgi:SHS2 domain-containing protein